MSLQREILSGVSGVAGVRLMNIAIGFATSIALARYLGPEGYGAYAFVLSLITSLALLSYAGLPPLIVRETVKYQQNDRWGLIRGIFRRGHQFVVVSGVVILVITALVGGSLMNSGTPDRWRLLLLASPLIPILALSHLKAAGLRGFRRVVSGSVSEMLVRPGVFLVVFMGVIWIGKPSPDVAIVCQIAACCAALLAGVLMTRNIPENASLKAAKPEYLDKEWLMALFPFMGIAGVSYINAEFITLFLGVTGSNHDVAIFRVAVSVGLIVGLPLSLVEFVIPPHITRLYSEGALDKIQYLVKLVSLSSLVMSLIPAIVFLVYGRELISLVYGDNYLDAYYPLVAVSAGYVLVNLVGLSMVLLYATEFHHAALRISAFGSLITLLLCFGLIPVLGALGAAIVVGCGKALRATMFVFTARRRLKIKTSLIW